MKLIARKPCSFGGERFYIGDEIPPELVLSPEAQEKMGVLAIVRDDAGAPAHTDLGDPAGDITVIPVVVRSEKGDLTLELTQEGLQAVVDVLTSKVEDAEPVVAAMTDADALILLHSTDTRKAIKAAAEARAEAIDEKPEESAGDQ